jgi:hypothetical protein
MSRLRSSFLLLLVVTAVGGEPLPPPTPLPPADHPPAALAYPPAAPYRVSRYAIWQYYGVNRAGQFVPRVIDGPFGAYYLYSGVPYPWAATRPGQYMPYASD